MLQRQKRKPRARGRRQPRLAGFSNARSSSSGPGTRAPSRARRCARGRGWCRRGLGGVTKQEPHSQAALELLQKRARVLEGQNVRLRQQLQVAREEEGQAAVPAVAAGQQNEPANTQAAAAQQRPRLVAEDNPIIAKWAADKRLQKKVDALQARLQVRQRASCAWRLPSRPPAASHPLCCLHPWARRRRQLRCWPPKLDARGRRSRLNTCVPSWQSTSLPGRLPGACGRCVATILRRLMRLRLLHHPNSATMSQRGTSCPLAATRVTAPAPCQSSSCLVPS